MLLFDHEDYKTYVIDRVNGSPKKGYGQYRKMAAALGISTVTVSQIFKGDRHLTLEHAYELSKYFGLSDAERRFFLQLVQIARAGTSKYRDHLKNELAALREKSKDLKTRLPVDKELSDSAKAIFYSDAAYSAVRLLTSISGYSSLDAIATRLEIPIERAGQIVEFLLAHGLCVEKKGEILMGPSRTHLESSSPYIKARQISWRLKGFERMNHSAASEDLYYTAPMALSKKAAQTVHNELMTMIQKLNAIVPSSKSEELACLNIDWFKF